MRRRLAACLSLLLSACAAPLPETIGPATQPPQLTEIFFVPADGVKLPLTQWRPPESFGPPQGVVLILHGLGLHAGVFAPLSRGLAERGLIVYAYDHRGFGGAPDSGRWFGGDQLAADARTALALLRARHPDLPLTLIGESMGAAVAMVAAVDASPLEAPDRLVLSAPAVWGRATMPGWMRTGLEIGGRLLPWFPASSAGTGRIPTDNVDALRALGQDPLVQRVFRMRLLYGLVELMEAAAAVAPRLPIGTLILVGAKDRIVDRGAFADFLERAAPAARAKLYPDGWHLLFQDLNGAAVVDDVAAWATQGAVPGADAPAAAALRRDPVGAR